MHSILFIILIFSISLNLILILKNSSLLNKYNLLLTEIAKNQFEKPTQKKDAQIYKKGDYLPNFIFKTFDNNYIDLSELKSNNLLLIYFKFSDCDVCYSYLINAQRNISFYENKGIEVVGISDQNIKIINDFINKKDITIPIALDRGKIFKSLVCIFRSKVAIDSDSNRPLILIESGHPFRFIPATFSMKSEFEKV
ncbi:MAG: redoxin domain-containing protein, partial [Acidobacteriota bacterium]